MSMFRPSSSHLGLACMAAALLSAGCANVPSADAPPAASASSAVPNLFDTQRAIAEYVDSGRYQADFGAVVAQARAWLETRAPAVMRPAIVLDIDETSLSNWPAYRVNGWARILNGDCDLEKGPCNIHQWQELGRSAALPSTLELTQRARQLGIAVFFISGRPASEQAATERNLHESISCPDYRADGHFRGAR